METVETYKIYSIDPFWDEEYKKLPFVNKPFNDPISVGTWIGLGFQSKITGDLAAMPGPQPSWNWKIIKLFEEKGWKDIGTAYYLMTSGTVMPRHQDLYKSYVNTFGLVGREKNIRRALIFLEDWSLGHYLDIDNKAFVEWKKGDVVEWIYDTPHTAANIGFNNRYTLQVTGHL